MIDACDTTVIDPIVFDPNVSTLAIVLPIPDVGTDEIYIPDEPQDSASITYGNNDGYTFCGARQIHVVDLADNSEFDLATSPFVSITGQTLTFTPTSIGVYSISIEYSLVNYPSIARSTKTVTITVTEPCKTATVIDPVLFDDTAISALTIILPYPVLDSDVIYISTEPEDSASRLYGLQDGYQFCGARELFVVDLADGSEFDLTTSTFVTFDIASSMLTFTPT